VTAKKNITYMVPQQKYWAMKYFDFITADSKHATFHLEPLGSSYWNDLPMEWILDRLKANP